MHLSSTAVSLLAGHGDGVLVRISRARRSRGRRRPPCGTGRGRSRRSGPGMNQVVRMPKRRNSSTSRGTPTSPENRPARCRTASPRLRRSRASRPPHPRRCRRRRRSPCVRRSGARGRSRHRPRPTRRSEGLGLYRRPVVAHVEPRGGLLRSCHSRCWRNRGSTGGSIMGVTAGSAQVWASGPPESADPPDSNPPRPGRTYRYVSRGDRGGKPDRGNEITS